MIRIPPVKLSLVVFLQCADVVLFAYNDRSSPYLAGTLVLILIHCFVLLQLCNMLATDIDSIRKEYWNYVSRRLGAKYGQNSG